jgi:transposase
MDIIAAYREAGTFRGAAEIAGTTHKTVRRVIARHEAGGAAPERAPRGRNYDGVAALVAERVGKTSGRISAKRLLPAARAAGYAGSDRNFRRVVAEQKALWRREHHRGRRPAVWSPGEHLVIDWGAEGGLHVFCAVLAWCRFRFVRFAADERAATTLAMLAECFEVLGGVPGKVLADRMGCLEGGVVANVVVPAAEYARFAGHYGFRPDFCEAHDPESKPRVAYCTFSGRSGVFCCCPGGDGSGGVRHSRRVHAVSAGAVWRAGLRSLSLRPCARAGGLSLGGG